jgi:acetyl-CoA synthetase
MVEKYLKQTHFKDLEDFNAHFELIVPKHFNFAYDVVDEWAAIQPNKRALYWTNDQGECRIYTFAEIKQLSDQAASWFQSLGIGRGDMVMLILKRRAEFWISIIALHKLGAVAIPAPIS